ncbi:hypothetical protein SAMN04487866_12136, partial [Thermoactinomyces sp. DSM 45891]|uniref:hypothetical protein n=1 Tax=Thermoactinomyces sp. DSM 45891 TaxID=1761907 RepID=UPI00090F65A0
AVKKIVNNVKKATQSATKSVSQFINGARDRINSNIFTLGLADLSDPNEEKGVAYHVGAVAGDIFSMLVGVSAGAQELQVVERRTWGKILVN